MPRPLYLGFGRRIDQEDATDRSRPWSTKLEKTAKKSKGRRALLSIRRESPNSCLGPLLNHEGSPNLQGRAKLKGRRRELNWSL
jgi:hypothetical protein